MKGKLYRTNSKVMIVQKNQIFQRKGWMSLITKAFALILGITLTLPTFAATAAPLPEGTWQLVNPPYGPFELNLHDGSDYGTMICNSHFGSYKAVPGKPCVKMYYPINFGPQASTKVGCKGNDLESRYSVQLQSVDNYSVCQDHLILSGKYGSLEYTRAGY